MSKASKAPTLWKFLSIENWITLILVVLVVGWSLLDFFLPPESIIPNFSMQLALSITVAAVAASLILLQARINRVESAVATKSDLGDIITGISNVSSSIEDYAQRADAFARKTAPNQIDGRLIPQELDTLLQSPNTALWKFRGGSGRWQRDVVLPQLAKIKDRDVAYKMLILDPREDRLCSLYARYRNTHRRDGEIETIASIRLQIAACIVAAIWASLLSRVKPEIRLGGAYSPLRLDLGASGAMLTVSDLTQPGLLASSESWFYRALDDELERLAERAPEIVVDDTLLDPFGPDSVLDEKSVKAILSVCSVRDPGKASTESLFNEAQLNDLDLATVARISWPQAVASPEGTR
ncbi:hypothetical protein [Microbacterium maritypicum]